MSNPGPLLQVDALTRHFERGRVQALRGVSFAAEAGEVVAVMGPSGCGKSTLLSLIGLLDQPTSGSIRIGGEDLAAVKRPAGFRARRLGFVFQFHHLVGTMTVQENVAAPLVAAGEARARRMARAAELLELLDLADRADFLPAKLSGGERQRAAVARALITRPAVVLADEPTGNLDSVSGARVVELLLGHARRQGALLLMATHNPEIAARADRRIALLDGQLQAPRAGAD